MIECETRRFARSPGTAVTAHLHKHHLLLHLISIEKTSTRRRESGGGMERWINEWMNREEGSGGRGGDASVAASGGSGDGRIE